ncbi:hypothetical protein C8R43DRAFT_1140831 [Mycena crocata]|nr:hypothetical protein C8R43DRAFT_1140831 [Mycena crocata]
MTATSTDIADTGGGSTAQQCQSQHGSAGSKLNLGRGVGWWGEESDVELRQPSDQPTFPNTPLPPTSNKGLSRSPTAFCAPNRTSTTSSSTPTTSSTTSLIAGGGNDLDDGRCHSRQPPIARANTGSIALVVADGELKDPDLVISGGADGLSALSAQSAHLGTVHLPRHAAMHRQCARRPQRRTPDETAPRLLWGSFGTPAHHFPRLNLPRRGSHAPIANAPLPGAGSQHHQPALAAHNSAIRIKPRVGLVQSVCYLAAPERTPALTPLLKNIPWRRFRCPWEVSSAGSPDESLVEAPGCRLDSPRSDSKMPTIRFFFDLN